MFSDYDFEFIYLILIDIVIIIIIIFLSRVYTARIVSTTFTKPFWESLRE